MRAALLGRMMERSSWRGRPALVALIATLGLVPTITLAAPAGTPGSENAGARSLRPPVVGPGSIAALFESEGETAHSHCFGAPPVGRTIPATPHRADRVVEYARGVLGGRINAWSIRKLDAFIQPMLDEYGRATPELETALMKVDQELGGRLSKRVLARFQGILGRVGVKTDRRILIPVDNKPYWLLGEQPLANYQSSDKLPETADVVIIGAGLTGASAAYHLVSEARAKGLTVVVLDSGDPANEASGRNGGNFELFPENYVGVYKGLEKERFSFMQRLHPDVPEAALRAEAARQARAILKVTGKNRDRFKEIIESEHIAADYSPKGWLRIAHSATEEQGLIDESTLASSLGLGSEVWSAERIKKEKGIDTKFSGRWTPDGNYHPFKYASGLLQLALKRGAQLYTRTRVSGVTAAGDEQVVNTPRGAIRAKQVIAATNAFTSKLFPELKELEAYQSQIMITEHAPVTYSGLFTMKQGDYYAHYRDDSNRYADPALAASTDGKLTERAPYLQGGGRDRPFKDADKRRISGRVHDIMLGDRDTIVPGLKGQPPSRAWTGAMGFTPDRIPVMGFLRPGVIVVGGFNGYGGSYTTAAGMAAAEMAATNKVPEWIPEKMFSPRRLMTKEPLFDTTTP